MCPFYRSAPPQSLASALLSHPVRPSLLRLVSQSMGFESKQVLQPGFFFFLSSFFFHSQEKQRMDHLCKIHSEGKELSAWFKFKNTAPKGSKTFFFQKSHLWSLYSAVSVSKTPNNLNVALFTLICGKSNIQPWLTPRDSLSAFRETTVTAQSPVIITVFCSLFHPGV